MNALTGEEYLMVHDHLWEKYGVGNELLCISCFEKPLARPLNAPYLTDVPVNPIGNPYTKELINKE